ncbi:hypothetical protein P154DRAFT_438278, partial [Amniculicola lignicola CBS 123094]
FLSLYNNFLGKYLFSSIFRISTLLYRSDLVIGGVYPTIYLTNYSYIHNFYNN